MQVSPESGLQVAAGPPGALAAFATESVASGDANPKDLVYDLRLGGRESGQYYLETARFANKLLAEIELRAGAALDAYSLYSRNEPPRSRGEYAIELLTLGQAVRRYRASAESTPEWALQLARVLFRLRRFPWLKPVADPARAAIVKLLMLPKTGRNLEESRSPIERLPHLIDWLKATGEFEQEAIRLGNWRGFLDTLAPDEAVHWIRTAVALFDWFERHAERALGAYTRGVSGFLAGEYAHRGCREDQIFCGRQSSEYHLNMVAAEIVNRGLRAQFEQTSRKAVLVPACMRGARASTCRARVSGVDIVCTACDPACQVNRLTKKMRGLGAKVYLVPHSTGFSRWLERWQREPETGVTAVACMLNILPGGYEMRARGIASQCVPLDFPGCAKHWRKKPIATRFNEDRLVQILTSPST